MVSGEIHTPDALSKEKVLMVPTEYEARWVPDMSQKVGEEKNPFLMHKVQTKFIGQRSNAPCNLSHTKLPLNFLRAHTVTLIPNVYTVTNLSALGSVHTAR